ncbi:MAG: LysR substrate-binding domain-containing protein [Candidatus Cryptobacteroides sp.]
MFRYKVFLSVADNLSFTKAAQELYISQPAVSKHISELEKEFQLTLFKRDRGQISLTREGEALKQKALKLIACQKELEDEMRLLRGGVDGELKIGASSTIAQYVIAPILARFKELFPQLGITLVTGNSEQVSDSLAAERIDLALVEGGKRRNNMRYKEFCKDEIVLVSSASNPVEEVDIEELKSLPIVLREQGSGTLDVIERALAGHSLGVPDLNVQLNISATEAIKSYLKAAPNCYGLLSIAALNEELRSGELKIIDIDGLTIERDFSFVSRLGELDAVSERFVEFAEKWRDDNYKL